jgi:cobalamin biosynthesis protein CbiD
VTTKGFNGTVTKSVTLYTGNEGEEKASKTYNYNFEGSSIKTTTEYVYSNDTLSKSITVRGENGTFTRSITLYTGNEGEEKAQKTYNYNYDATEINTTTLFIYSNDTLEKAKTVRGEDGSVLLNRSHCIPA